MTSDSEDRQRAFHVASGTVLGIAWPMTLAYLSTPLVGIVDTAVIGRLGQPVLLGGIAVGAMVFSIIFTSFNFLRSGTTGLTAQALGAQDLGEQRAVLLRAVLLALALGLLVVIVHRPFFALAFMLMGASASVEQVAREYAGIRIFAAPLILLNYVLLGWFLGLGRAATGLALQSVLNGVNIAASVVLVFVFGLGVAGVAWASLGAELVTALLGVLLAGRRLRGQRTTSRAGLFDGAALRRVLALNRDILVRSFVLLAAFAFFTAQGARTGDLVLAANAVLLNFFMIGGYFLDGFATAAEQLAGRAVGARYRPAFDRTVRYTLLWGFALAGGLSLIFWIGGELFIAALTTAEAVRATAGEYLIWAAMTPLVGVVAFQMDGVFIGATWSADMRNMMLISMAAYVACWWLVTPALGNHGLWLALQVFLIVRGVTLAARLPARAAATFAASVK